MASVHVRAVQKQIGKFINRRGYDILCVIACDTGQNGEPAETTNIGIAERTGVHRNTVSSHLKSLEEAGWIRIEQRDGKRKCYLTIEGTRSPNMPMADAPTPPDDYEIRLAAVEEKLNLILGLLHNAPEGDCALHNAPEGDCALPEVGVTGGAKNGLHNAPEGDCALHNLACTTLQRGIVHEVLEEKNIYIYGGRSQNFQHPEPVNRMVMAIQPVVKTALTGKTENDFVDTAYLILGWNSTEQEVSGFQEWWDEFGLYPGMPALKSFTDEYRNYLRSKKTGGQAKDTSRPAAAGPVNDNLGGFYG